VPVPDFSREVDQHPGTFPEADFEIISGWRVNRPVLPSGQYRLSPGVEAVLAAQFFDVRFGTQPPGKSRFVAIGRQLSYPLKF
jgi:hypothetical protein